MNAAQVRLCYCPRPTRTRPREWAWTRWTKREGGPTLEARTSLTEPGASPEAEARLGRGNRTRHSPHRPALTGDLVAGLVNPTTCVDLLGFRCGPGTTFPRAEKEVNNLIAQCCARTVGREKVSIRVTREVPPGTLVGVTGLERGSPNIQHPKFRGHFYNGAAYVAVIALSERYRDDKDPYRTKEGERLG